MASKACLLFLSFLVVSRAQPVLIERASANLVTDGDFHDATSSCFFKQDITCAGWTVTGSAEIVDGNTPGANYASVFNGPPRDTGGTISQEIEGLSTAETYTLSYDYRKYFNYKPTACTLTVTLGSQTLDSVRLPADTGGDHEKYITRTRSFTPAQDSGTLALKVSCPRSKGSYEVDLDNISITGSA